MLGGVQVLHAPDLLSNDKLGQQGQPSQPQPWMAPRISKPGRMSMASLAPPRQTSQPTII
jgi:hypothetical protein